MSTQPLQEPSTQQRIHEVIDTDSYERLIEVLDDEAVLRDGDRNMWLVFSTEDGEFYAVRPRTEDDGQHEDDTWRPIGPEPIETLPYPWFVAWPAVPSLVCPATIAGSTSS